jgi:hypothetical protein
MTAALTLAAFLVLNGSAPAVATADCQPDDNGCKARRSELRAASAQTPDQRATYLRSAHRSYLFLFNKTGDALDLCAARRTFDASMAVKDQSADEHARTQALHDDLVARERKTGATCKGVAKQRRASKSEAQLVVASVPDPPKASPDDVAADAGEADPPPLLTSSTPKPLPTTKHAPPISPNPPRLDVALMPIPARREPPRHDTGAARPGRGLVIAGGVTLGVGVALTAAAGLMARRMPETRQEYFALHDMVGGFATAEQEVAAGALLRDYQVMGKQVVALGVAGGTTIVLAAVLAGVGGRRMARAASRTALVPIPGGLALHGRF